MRFTLTTTIFFVVAQLIYFESANASIEGQPTKKKSNAIKQLSKNSVNAFYGSFTTEFPIVVPKFHDITPELGFSYSSDRSNGPLGVGWDLTGLSSIVRVGKNRGAANYDATDVYLLDGNELIPCNQQTDLDDGSLPKSPSCKTGGTHSAKIEDYRRITYDNSQNKWIIFEKDGTQLIYDRVRGLGGKPDIIYRLAKVTDVHGNIVNYSYNWFTPTAINGRWPRVQIDKIHYNNGNYEIKFFWEDRPDLKLIPNSGILEQEYKRLSSVAVYVRTDGQKKILRIYDLSYITSGTTKRSKISSIQLFGSDAVIDEFGNISNKAEASSMPAVEYEYWQTGPGWESSDEWNETAFYHTNFESPTTYPKIQTLHLNSRLHYLLANKMEQIVDINSDGLSDFVFSNSELRPVNDPQFKFNEVWINTGSGFQKEEKWTLPDGVFFSRGQQNTFSVLKTMSFFVELNGDGRIDILTWKLINPNQTAGLINPGDLYGEVHLNNGNGWTLDTSNRWTWAPQETADFFPVFADINGDGRQDLIFSTNYNGVQKELTFKNTDDGWVAVPQWQIPLPLNSFRPSTRLIDLHIGKHLLCWESHRLRN